MIASDYWNMFCACYFLLYIFKKETFLFRLETFPLTETKIIIEKNVVIKCNVNSILKEIYGYFLLL